MNTATLPDTASRSFAAPAMARAYGVGSARFTVTATIADGHFSVTAELRTGDRRYRDPVIARGCMHEDAGRLWPAVKPLIALHLSDANTGEPMHAEANGWYWLAGALGGLGEQYHGGSGSDARTPEQCAAILADHLRIGPLSAHKLIREIEHVVISPTPDNAPRKAFAAYVDAQRPRWQTDAEAGRVLIASLAA